MADSSLATAVAEIDRYVAYLQDPEKVWGHIATRTKLGELVVGHWATIRAGLDQMSKREPTIEEKLAEAKPIDSESLAADPPLSDEESEAFEQALRWPDDERMERLEGALRELLKAGAHDGPCDNEDNLDDRCGLHLVAYADRKNRAMALLGDQEGV